MELKMEKVIAKEIEKTVTTDGDGEQQQKM